MALMPLALLALEGRPRDIIIFRQAARLATFAVLPLIPGGADGVTKLLVVLAEELCEEAGGDCRIAAVSSVASSFASGADGRCGLKNEP